MRESTSILLDPVAAIPELHLVGRLMAGVGAHAGLRPHRHGFFEICHLHRGSSRWWATDSWHEVQGGDFFVTKPHEPHGGDRSSLDACTLYWLQIAVPEAPDDSTFLNLPSTEAEGLAHELRNLPRAPFPQEQPARPMFTRLLDLMEGERDALTDIEVRSTLAVLLANVVRSGRRDRNQAASPLVDEAKAVMAANLAEPLALGAIALRLGVSAQALQRGFRDQCGLAPGEYYLRQRVREAVRQLEETTDNITTVAYAVGFSSSQHFATAVKRVTGRSPRSFRSTADQWPGVTTDAPLELGESYGPGSPTSDIATAAILNDVEAAAPHP